MCVIVLHDQYNIMLSLWLRLDSGSYIPLRGPSRVARASTVIFSTALRSAREQWGGSEYPRMERPVRTRDDSTYFGSRSSPPFRLSGLRSVKCLAS